MLEHLYGPGDQEFKFVSWVVRECIRNVERLNLTACNQLRDFIYIDDAVNAYNCLLNESSHLNSGYNLIELGTGVKHSLRDFIEIVVKVTSTTSYLDFGILPYRKYEQMESSADNSYLRKLGWEWHTDIVEGIKNIVAEIRDKHLIKS
jgi:CDP-paratose synthetase